ncbi:acyltransferase family protein [Stenotrophomonas indicatrix]|uniref:acyltransferase family protein n=1 Tax=Stenotrophomonas indicatrix TaxID=2045451 RepID=UPI00080BF418|nr:acyltransferase [Stenotrophomonas indicatrix]
MTRENNFDAMRIVAALVVIFGHAHPLSAQPDPTLLGNAVQSVAVKIFFVVSGFLVAKSWWSDPHVGRFLLRRGLRLFPALFVLLALTILVLGPLFTTLPIHDYVVSEGTIRYFIYNMVLYPVYALPGVFADNPYPGAVNGSLWSLPVEVSMYLLLPVIAIIAALARSKAVFVAISLIGIALSLYYLIAVPAENQIVWWGTGSRSVADVGPYFFLGAIVAVTPIERVLNPGGALFLVAIAALFQLPQYWMQQLVLMMVLPYVVLSFSTTATPFISKAGRFGDPSYGIYLYGFPVQQALFAVGGISMGPLENTVFAVPIVVALAYLSWHLVEKRALSFKPGKRLAGGAVNSKEIPSS